MQSRTKVLLAVALPVAFCFAVLGLGVVLMFATRPKCPTGYQPVLLQYSGWACLVGAPPLQH